MTAAEQQRFTGYFPNLNVQTAVVTDEADPIYNCIAWTVGIVTVWIWPGDHLDDFDQFYLGFGFTRSSNGPVAAWGLSPVGMKHGCVSGEGHGPRWESKCGADLRIQHGLSELAGSSYGHVIAYYFSASNAEAPFGEVVRAMKKSVAKSYLTAAQRRKLRDRIEEIPTETRRAFADAFAAWKETWYEGGLGISSNPAVRGVGKNFDTLIAMGPIVLPLVVEELARPENFFALQLYDAMQPRAELVIHIAPGDERILEGEQGRARRTVQAWFADH
jgi:hypothetical protein